MNKDFVEKIDKAAEFHVRGQFQEALQLLDEVASALMRLAVEYAQADGGAPGSSERAGLVREYLRRDDSMVKVATYIAAILARAGKYEKAKEYYEEAIAFRPENFDFNYPELGLVAIRETQSKKERFKPLIAALAHPSLEEVDGLDELTTKEIVDMIKLFSDSVILGFARKNQEHKGRYGFILNPRAFGISKSKNRLAEILKVLLDRFGEAQKNTSDWKKLVGHLIPEED
jgi:tetratricopeptide (TPR) repeat protein